ncbi:MAG: TonB-dependent receptor domain-containing protein [bacterium]
MKLGFGVGKSTKSLMYKEGKQMQLRKIHHFATLIVSLCLLVSASDTLAQGKGTITGKVMSAAQEALPGANVTIVGTLRGSSVSTDGTYSFAVEPGTYTIRASFIGYSAEEKEVQVVADEAVTVDFQLEEDVLSMSEILVTGSRTRGRTAMKSPVPIDTFHGKILERQGNGEMTETLKNVVPSFTATPLTGDGAAFVRPTSLRGLPPDDILVLMNSKRRHRSSLISHFGAAMNVGAHAVDVGMIPSIALKKLEILRDGASAQYGSDAIAGVMNFILKDNSKGIEVQATTSRWYTAPNDRGRETDVKLAVNAGLPLTKKGFLNLSGEYISNPELSRGVQHASAAEGYKGWTAGADVDDWDPAMNWGRPKSSGFRSVWNAGLTVGDHAEAYSFGNYADTEGNYSFFYRAPGRTGALTPIPLDPTDPSKGNFSWGDTFPLGFTPRLQGDQKDFSGVVGLRGKLELGNGLDYDLSASYGYNRISYTLNGSLNLSWGPDSPFVFDIGDLRQSETNYNADFSYPLSDKFNVAFGAEWREEVYQMFEGQKESWSPGPWAKVHLLIDPETGENYTPPGLVANGMRGTSRDEAGIFDRQNTAIYVDAEWDVSEDFLIQAAGRFEDFSDFGTTTNGKLAARFSLSDQFALRAAVSTGFRAPTPGQANVTTIVTSFDGVTGEQIQEGTVRPDDPLAVALGGAALEPEDALNFSFGLTARPSMNLSLTVDAYQIDVDSRIIKSRALPVDPVQHPDVFRELQELAFYTNALDTRTKGLDVVAVFNLNQGEVTNTNFSLAYNYNETDVLRQREIGGQLPVTEGHIRNIEENLPKHRANVTVVQGLTDKFSAMLRGNYYGSTVDERGTKEEVGSEILVDLELTYRVSNALRLIGGANNIFNNYPDEISTRLSQGMPYPRRTPISYNGGLVYLRAVYQF